MIFQINDYSDESIGLLSVEPTTETLQDEWDEKELIPIARDLWESDPDNFWDKLVKYLNGEGIRAERVYLENIYL